MAKTDIQKKIINFPKTTVAANGDEPLGIEGFHAYDRMREAALSRLTGGISPRAMATAYFDWAVHLGWAHGKQMELVVKAARKWQRMLAWTWFSALDAETPPVIEPLPGDHRFSHEGWQKPSFNRLAQAFLLQQ